MVKTRNGAGRTRMVPAKAAKWLPFRDKICHGLQPGNILKARGRYFYSPNNLIIMKKNRRWIIPAGKRAASQSERNRENWRRAGENCTMDSLDKLYINRGGTGCCSQPYCPISTIVKLCKIACAYLVNLFNSFIR